MKHHISMTKQSKWPKVWGVDDPSIIDLSDEYTAIELFVEEPDVGFYHIFRFMIDTVIDGHRVCSEGILLGQSDNEDRPKLPSWAGQTPGLQLLSCVNLGSEVYGLSNDPETAVKLSGQINDDPIVFLNFDPATTTARFMTSLDCVPEPVRERHLRVLQAPAVVA